VGISGSIAAVSCPLVVSALGPKRGGPGALVLLTAERPLPLVEPPVRFASLSRQRLPSSTQTVDIGPPRPLQHRAGRVGRAGVVAPLKWPSHLGPLGAGGCRHPLLPALGSPAEAAGAGGSCDEHRDVARAPVRRN